MSLSKQAKKNINFHSKLQHQIGHGQGLMRTKLRVIKKLETTSKPRKIVQFYHKLDS